MTMTISQMFRMKPDEWDKYEAEKVEIPLMLLGSLTDAIGLLVEGRRLDQEARDSWKGAQAQANALFDERFAAVFPEKVDPAK